MADLQTSQIRNVALAAHNGAGKTSLADALFLLPVARHGRARSTTRRAFLTSSRRSNAEGPAFNWQCSHVPGKITGLIFWILPDIRTSKAT